MTVTKKVRLLILAEWLLNLLKEKDAREVLELIESRFKAAFAIFCSRFDVPQLAHLYVPALTNAICNRIVYDSYVIRIIGDTIRKRKCILTE